MLKLSTLSFVTLVLFACDPEPDDAPSPEEVGAIEAPGPGLVKAAKTSVPEAAKHGEIAVMPDAERAFLKARELIAKYYVDPAVGEAALYTGAVEGMMARLAQLPNHPVNELMSPRELDELVHGTQGTLVGIGVMIEQVADIVVVREVITGGPAAKSDLRRGDRLLAIDGERIQGKPMVEIVDKIRGAAGTEVDLFVQRDTEEWHAKLVRATVAIQNIESKLIGEGLGYVRLRGFAETTPAELDAAIEALQKAGAEALVLDLRSCPGGMFDASIVVTGAFLRDGQAIVTTTGRDEAGDTRVAKGDGRWHALPLAVLIGPDTASGAEILADALAAHKRATLIGQPTLGKGTVESIHELGNGWALKLSTHRFVGASGEPLQGRGVRPHVPVAVEEMAKPEPLETISVDTDAAVGLARTWLEGQAR